MMPRPSSLRVLPWSCQGLLAAATLLLPLALPAQQADSWWTRYEARVPATQNEQPHWITPLVLVTPRLEQEFRTDFVHQYNPAARAVWIYDNSKGLGIIPFRRVELLVNVPPFYARSNGESDGFGDMSFNSKFRIFSRNEESGN